MRIFACSCPTHPRLFFESTSCETCGKMVGFSHKENTILAFEPTSTPELFKSEEDPTSTYRQCENYSLHKACNGMIAIDPAQALDAQPGLCDYCRYNHTIPNLSVEGHAVLWRKLESAKRRTLFTLNQLDLPVPDRLEDPVSGLCFDFMADKTVNDHFQSPLPNQAQVFTGHEQGRITINLAEADEVARANVKDSMGERYRTLLGHFRHEIGHYFWDQLIANNPKNLSAFRKIFGNEELDYQAALEKHYQEGAPKNWEESYISSYATMHPWEDWAETWAHYLHVVDTLETAQSFGVQIKPAERPEGTPAISSLKLPQQVFSYYDKRTSIDMILDAWINFSVVLNSLNRSMGLPDAYPFVLYPKIRKKINFIHSIIYESRKNQSN